VKEGPVISRAKFSSMKLKTDSLNETPHSDPLLFFQRERESATESPRLFAELSARSYNTAKLDSHTERKLFSALNSR
jgi:hypothetical protein